MSEGVVADDYSQKIEDAWLILLHEVRDHEGAYPRNLKVHESVNMEGNWLVALNARGNWRVCVRITDGEVLRFKWDCDPVWRPA